MIVIAYFTFTLLISGLVLAVIGMMADHDGIVGIGGLTILCSIIFGMHLSQTIGQ